MEMSEQERNQILLDKYFYYEVFRMRESFFAFKHRLWDSLLVDFLVHVRILHEFFYGSKIGEKKKRAHADNYIEGYKVDVPFKDFEEHWNRQMNDYTFHLSFFRVEGINREYKYRFYSIDDFYKHFGNLVIEFLNKLPEDYKVGSKLKELLEILKEEIE